MIYNTNISFRTNKGEIIFNIKEYNTLCELIFIEKWDGCIIMFVFLAKGDCFQAMTNLIIIKNIIPRFNHIPIIILGNKIDLPSSIKNLQSLSNDLENGDIYFSMSAKSNYNFEKAYTYLIRVLFDAEFI